MRKPIAMLLATMLLMPSVSTFATLNAPQAEITIGFSPSGTALSNILHVINSAQQEINIAAYSFTSKEIALALRTAQQRGVRVQVLADKKANSDKYTAVTFLANSGIAVRLSDKYAIMHNKFIVTDGQTVETGSYNFSASADKRNAENTLVLWNMPAVAAQYQQEFERLWQEGEPLITSWKSI
ncbi:phospholipase D family nuclease [Yersinia pseudotuberculosis]